MDLSWVLGAGLRDGLMGASCLVGLAAGQPMLTGTREREWAVVFKVFRAAFSGRGDKGRDDRKFLGAAPRHGARYHLAGTAGAVRSLERCAEALVAAEPIRCL